MRNFILWLIAFSVLLLITVVAFTVFALVSLCRPWMVLVVVFVGLTVFLRYTIADAAGEMIKDWIDKRI